MKKKPKILRVWKLIKKPTTFPHLKKGDLFLMDNQIYQATGKFEHLENGVLAIPVVNFPKKP